MRMQPPTLSPARSRYVQFLYNFQLELRLFRSLGVIRWKSPFCKFRKRWRDRKIRYIGCSARGGWGGGRESAFGLVLLFTITEFHNQAIMNGCTARKWSVAIAHRDIKLVFASLLLTPLDFTRELKNVIKRHESRKRVSLCSLPV